MKYLLLIMLLVGCSSVSVKRWGVLRCPPHDSRCTMGDVGFKTLQTCEAFVEAARQAQPTTIRICKEL